VKLTIVMYHYVRDPEATPYPEIRALRVAGFLAQLTYLVKNYTIIAGQTLLDALAAEATDQLPPAPALLTFDDGYADHAMTVLPALERERLTACFFPPGSCVVARRVLDVNKIHFVLAAANLSELLDDVRSWLGRRYEPEAIQAFWQRLASPSRFDPAEIMFVKRLLQRELPLAERRTLLDELFAKYVTADEAAFADELYMSARQLRGLREAGMYVGSHGYEHYWLDSLTPEEQQRDVDLSLRFLTDLGVDTQRWIMCYPYGAHNKSLRELLRQRGCAVGLSTRVGVAELGHDDLLALPRLDTNDLPSTA
jgi:peptidoglycan/xylan/chitin deacetylase (PgdA/CDA1 family)